MTDNPLAPDEEKEVETPLVPEAPETPEPAVPAADEPPPDEPASATAEPKPEVEPQPEKEPEPWDETLRTDTPELQASEAEEADDYDPELDPQSERSRWMFQFRGKDYENPLGSFYLNLRHGPDAAITEHHGSMGGNMSQYAGDAVATAGRVGQSIVGAAVAFARGVAQLAGELEALDYRIGEKRPVLADKEWQRELLPGTALGGFLIPLRAASWAARGFSERETDRLEVVEWLNEVGATVDEVLVQEPRREQMARIREYGGLGTELAVDAGSNLIELVVGLKLMQIMAGVTYGASAPASTAALGAKTKALVSQMTPQNVAQVTQAARWAARMPAVTAAIQRAGQSLRQPLVWKMGDQLIRGARLAAIRNAMSYVPEDETTTASDYWMTSAVDFFWSWMFMSTPAVSKFVPGAVMQGKYPVLSRFLTGAVDTTANSALTYWRGDAAAAEQAVEAQAAAEGLGERETEWRKTAARTPIHLLDAVFGFKTASYARDRMYAQRHYGNLMRDAGTVVAARHELGRIIGDEMAREATGMTPEQRAVAVIKTWEGDAAERGDVDPIHVLADSLRESESQTLRQNLNQDGVLKQERLALDERLRALRDMPDERVLENFVFRHPETTDAFRAAGRHVREVLSERIKAEQPDTPAATLPAPTVAVAERLRAEIAARAGETPVHRQYFQDALEKIEAYRGEVPLADLGDKDLASLIGLKGTTGKTFQAVREALNEWQAAHPKAVVATDVLSRPVIPPPQPAVRKGRGYAVGDREFTGKGAKARAEAHAAFLAKRHVKAGAERLGQRLPDGSVIRDSLGVRWTVRKDPGEPGRLLSDDGRSFPITSSRGIRVLERASVVSRPGPDVPETPSDVRYQDSIDDLSSLFSSEQHIRRGNAVLVSMPPLVSKEAPETRAIAGKTYYRHPDGQWRTSEPRVVAKQNPVEGHIDIALTALARGINAEAVSEAAAANTARVNLPESADFAAAVRGGFESLVRWVQERGGEFSRPGVRPRTQPSVSDGKPIGRDAANTEIDALAERTGGERIAGDAEGDNLGSINLHGVPINFRYSQVGEGRAGAIRQNEKGWTVFIDRDDGRMTTVRHEAGHAIADMLEPGERGLLERMGIDLSGRKGQEDFAARFESEESLKNFADEIRKLNPKDQGVIVRTVNKVIDFVNALFGSNIKHVREAGEIARLAESIEDFRVLRQLAEGGRVPAARDERGERGMLAGRQARTANVGMADRAVELERERIRPDMTPEQRETEYRKIADETGWHRVVDGEKWMFEVDDSKMKPIQERIPGLEIDETVRLSEVIDAPDLFGAYPELRDLTVAFRQQEGASWDARARTISMDRDELDSTNWGHFGSKTLAHEIQHAIQDIEGFRRGGSPESPSTDDIVYAAIGRVSSIVPDRDERTKYLNALRGHSWTWMGRKFGENPFDWRTREIDKVLSEIEAKHPGLREAAKDIPEPSSLLYSRLTGEALARVASRRLDMTPEQRKAESPRDTLKAMLTAEGLMREGQQPEDVLISRGGDGRADASPDLRFQDSLDRIAKDANPNAEDRTLIPDSLEKASTEQLRNLDDAFTRFEALREQHQRTEQSRKTDLTRLAEIMANKNLTAAERSEAVREYRTRPAEAQRLEMALGGSEQDAARVVRYLDSLGDPKVHDAMVKDYKLDIMDRFTEEDDHSFFMHQWYRQANPEIRDDYAMPPLTEAAREALQRWDAISASMQTEVQRAQREQGRPVQDTVEFYFPNPVMGQLRGLKYVERFFERLGTKDWNTRMGFEQPVTPSSMARHDERGLGPPERYWQGKGATAKKVRDYFAEHAFEIGLQKDRQGAAALGTMVRMVNEEAGVVARAEAYRRAAGEADVNLRMADAGDRMNTWAESLSPSLKERYSILGEKNVRRLASVMTSIVDDVTAIRTFIDNHYSIAESISGTRYIAGEDRLHELMRLPERVNAGHRGPEGKGGVEGLKKTAFDAILKEEERFYSPRDVRNNAFNMRLDNTFTRLETLRNQDADAFDKMTPEQVAERVATIRTDKRVQEALHHAEITANDVNAYQHLRKFANANYYRELVGSVRGSMQNKQVGLKGSTRNYADREMSFFAKMTGMIDRWATWKEYGDDIRLMEELATHFESRAKVSESGNYSTLAAYYRNWAAYGLLKQETKWDTTMYVKPWMRDVAHWTMQLKANAYLVGSPRFGLLTQWTSIAGVPARAGWMATSKGYFRALMGEMRLGEGVKTEGMDAHTVHSKSRGGSMRDIQRGYVDDIGGSLHREHSFKKRYNAAISVAIRWNEEFMTKGAWESARIKAEAEGVKGEAAAAFRNSVAATTQTIYSRQMRPIGLHSSVLRAASPFQSFAFESMGWVMRAAREWSHPAHRRTEDVMILDRAANAGSLVMAAVLVNIAHSMISGSDDDPKMTIWTTVPYFGRKTYRRGGRMAHELGFGPELVGMMQGVSTAVRTGNFSQLNEELIGTMPAAFGIGGGRVMKDIYRTAGALSNNGRLTMPDGTEGALVINTSDDLALFLDSMIMVTMGDKATSASRIEKNRREREREMQELRGRSRR